MNRSHDRLRKAVSAGVTVLMLMMSVAVPLLERADLSSGPVVEAEHAPGACHTGHDHTVCTQVGANAASSTTGQSHAPALSTVVHRVPGLPPTVASATFAEGHPSRAPPLA